MAHRALTVTAVAVATSVVVLAAAGCATSPAPTLPPPPQAVRDAAAATLAARTAATGLDVRTLAGGVTYEITGTGLVDLAHQSTDEQVRVPHLGTVRQIVVGSTVSIELPPSLRAGIGGKPWESFDLTDVLAPAAGSADTAGGNPADYPVALDRLAEDTHVVGTEPVDGARSTHYAGTVDLSRPVPGENPARAAAAERLTFGAVSPILPFDAWVSDGGRLRRQDLTIATPPRRGQPGATVTVSLHYSEFGVPFTVNPPPTEQVADLSSFPH